MAATSPGPSSSERTSLSTFVGARLRDTDLTDASLFGAKMNGGDFSGATLVGTQPQAVLGTYCPERS